MKKHFRCAIATLTVAATSACATPKESMLFGSADTFGVSISSATSGTGADFTLGYKGHDLAVIPAYASDDEGPITDSKGELQLIRSIGEGDKGVNDSFSVFGNFGVNTPTSLTDGEQNVGLSKFFATGAAAQFLASGFACQVALGSLSETSIKAFNPSDCLPHDNTRSQETEE